MEAHNCQVERSASRRWASFFSMIISITILPSLMFLNEPDTISFKVDACIWENAKVGLLNAIRCVLKYVYIYI